MEELFDRELRKTLEQGMQTHYPYKTKLLKDDKTLLSGGVIIFSKWPIIKESQIIYRAKTGWDALAAKGAVYALINKKGQNFNLIGTHLQAGNSSEGKKARQNQLQELASFIALLNIPNNQPFLIGGDFNIDASSPDINYLMATLNVNLIKNIGHPYSSDGTINSMHMGGDQVRIDYIFSSRNALAPKNEFNNIYILRALDDQKMWPNFDLSDHFPVAGFFDFRN